MEQNKKIVALGFFDGVHLGHQALLKECRHLADELGCSAEAITFSAHPKSLFSTDVPDLINSTHDRCALLRQQGMDQIHILPVTRQTMGQSWEAFLENFLRQGAAGFVCGYDFRFGHRGQGDAQKLEEFCRERGITCRVIPEQTLEGVRISSTHIRKLLLDGDVKTAAKFLGHNHVLSGTVVTGRKLGRTIGVPTANMLIPEGIALLRLGVYACSCVIDGKPYQAVTNVGSRPTVDGHQVRAESWILDFEGDLYGRQLMLEFCDFVRPERKFPSLADLQSQILRDAQKVRQGM
jgi:riboflavin kinase/FMN adenylyltransferase